jgi:hypothetical protein
MKEIDSKLAEVVSYLADIIRFLGNSRKTNANHGFYKRKAGNGGDRQFGPLV